MRNELAYTGIRLYNERKEIMKSFWDVNNAADTEWGAIEKIPEG